MQPDADPKLIRVLNRLLTEFENDAITSEEFRTKIEAMTDTELRILSRLLGEHWRKVQPRGQAGD